MYCYDFNGIHSNPFPIHICLPVNGDCVGLGDETPLELSWAFFYGFLCLMGSGAENSNPHAECSQGTLVLASESPCGVHGCILIFSCCKALGPTLCPWDSVSLSPSDYKCFLLGLGNVLESIRLGSKGGTVYYQCFGSLRSIMGSTRFKRGAASRGGS